MTDDEKGKAPKVEVLPAQSRGRDMPRAVFPESEKVALAIVKRMQIWGARRTAEELEKLVLAEARVIEAGERRNQAFARYRKSSMLLEELDDIVEHERKKVRLEMERDESRLRTELDEAKWQEEYQKSVRQVAELHKKIERDEALRHLDKRTGLERKLDDIREQAKLIGEYEKFKAELLKEHGVDREEELSELPSAILKKFRDAIVAGDKSEHDIYSLGGHGHDDDVIDP